MFAGVNLAQAPNPQFGADVIYDTEFIHISDLILWHIEDRQADIRAAPCAMELLNGTYEIRPFGANVVHGGYCYIYI